MQAQKLNKKQFSCRSRLFLIIAFFSFIILAGIIFILGSFGIIPIGEAWSKALGTLFAVLGVAFGLGQWLMPLPPLQFTNHASNKATNTPVTNNNSNFNLLPSHNMMKLPKDHNLRKKLEDNHDIKYGNKGSIIIYTNENLFRSPITLRAFNHQGPFDSRPEIVTAYVDREIIRFRAIYFAVFPAIREGNYKIDYVPLPFPLLGQNITVYEYQIIEIDGRIGN